LKTRQLIEVPFTGSGVDTLEDVFVAGVFTRATSSTNVSSGLLPHHESFDSITYWIDAFDPNVSLAHSTNKMLANNITRNSLICLANRTISIDFLVYHNLDTKINFICE